MTGCTLTHPEASPQLIGGTLMDNLYGLILTGNLFACQLDLDRQKAFAITGNRFVGPVNINQGTGTFVGNVFYGDAHLMGHMEGVVFGGNSVENAGSRLRDESTGQKAVWGNVRLTSGV